MTDVHFNTLDPLGNDQRAVGLALQANMASYSSLDADTMARSMQTTNGLTPSLTGPQLGGTANSFITAAGMTAGGSRNRATPGQVRLTHQQQVGYTTVPITDSPVVIYSVDTHNNEYETRSYRSPNYLRCASLSSADYHRNVAWQETMNDSRNVCIITPEDYRAYMYAHSHPVLGNFGDELPLRHVNPWEADQPQYHNRNYAFIGALNSYHTAAPSRGYEKPLAKRPTNNPEAPHNPHAIRLNDHMLTVQVVNTAEMYGSWAPRASSGNRVVIPAGSPAYHYVPALEPGFLLKVFVGYHRKRVVVSHSPFDLFDNRAQSKTSINVSIGPTSNPMGSLGHLGDAAGPAAPRFNIAQRWMHDAWYPTHGLAAPRGSNNMPEAFRDYMPVPVAAGRFEFTAVESQLPMV